MGNGRRSGRYVELGEGIGDVPVDGVLADEEPLRNRLIVEAGRNQPENLDLSWRQAFPLVGPGRRGCRARRQGIEYRAGARDLQTRAERCQIVYSAPGFVDGGLRTPERSHYPGELHA